MVLFKNKQRDEIMRELGRLAGMEERVEPGDESPEMKALFVRIRDQADHCVGLIDAMLPNVPRRIRPEWEQLRVATVKKAIIYNAASGEWENEASPPATSQG
jgi:hypothetical protein